MILGLRKCVVFGAVLLVAIWVVGGFVARAFAAEVTPICVHHVLLRPAALPQGSR